MQQTDRSDTVDARPGFAVVPEPAADELVALVAALASTQEWKAPGVREGPPPSAWAVAGRQEAQRGAKPRRHVGWVWRAMPEND